MVYDDVLQEVSNKLGEDLYILPSSIHEFIAVPKSLGGDPKEMAEMVRSINADVVKESERLSNQVFYYDANKREITQVSNTPILGIKDADLTMAVAEPHLPVFEAPSETMSR